MKRFHVHLHVQDLQPSIAFYTRLFSAKPARIESDYAKWMLEEPRINFAISTRGSKPGLDHLGFQVDSEQELVEMKSAAQNADMTLLDEGETTCCYARSDKHWITDPQGLAWEYFHTLGDIPVFNEAASTKSTSPSTSGAACCAPAVAEPASCATPKNTAVASCCSPSNTIATKSSCC